MKQMYQELKLSILILSDQDVIRTSDFNTFDVGVEDIIWGGNW